MLSLDGDSIVLKKRFQVVKQDGIVDIVLAENAHDACDLDLGNVLEAELVHSA